MKDCPALLVALSILLLFGLPVIAAEEDPSLPEFLESGSATLDVDGNRYSVPFSTTALGTLFPVDFFVRWLGGSLELGPLRQKHTLKIGDTPFIFGPGSAALTSGEEILSLSQPPQAGPGGLLVPLDLLQRIYSGLLGFEFDWRPGERTLTVSRRALREMPARVDLVHLQGVTTLVLQFPAAPRFRVDHSPDAIEVVLLGDRMRLESNATLPADPLVRGMTAQPEGIRFRLAPGVAAEEYTLDDPFRIVFDVYRRSLPGEDQQVRPPLPRRGTGIRTIVIDPGHGGRDTGALGTSGVTEKNLTLQLARALRSQLTRRLPVRVILTRNEDADLPLTTRTALANQQKADLFISLHVNSSIGRQANGAETYFLSLEASDEIAEQAALTENLAGQTVSESMRGDALYDLQLVLWDLAQTHFLSQSQLLGGLIQEELNRTLKLSNRGVKQAPFRVLMGAAMPAVLVELGFLSNPQEEARLKDPAYQASLAESLVRAITRFRAQTSGQPVEQEATQ